MEKDLTIKEQIEDLQAEQDRRMDNARALQAQHGDLVLSLRKMDLDRSREIEETLDGLPDASPKKIVDKILQISTGARNQIIGNIEKLKIAALNEKRKSDEASRKKDIFVSEIRENEIDELTVHAFNEFHKTVELYKRAEDHFYNVVLPAIDAGYNADSKFHEMNCRAKRLGLNKVISEVIDSHIKQGNTSEVGLDYTIARIRDAYNAYGPEHMLLDKNYRQQGYVAEGFVLTQ